MKTGQYQGANLYASEVEVMRLLEEQIGRYIPQEAEIGLNTFGFTAEDNRVTGLGLWHSQLFSLPERVGNLTNLKFLNLRGNVLFFLPNSIGQLVNLQKLDLGWNQLASLPETISHLVNLQELYLDGNQFSFLPETVSRLVNLEALVLSKNHLSSLPETIGHLVNLRRLHLGRNRLSSLPASFSQLSSLTYLDLTGNLFHKASLADQLGVLWLSRKITPLARYVLNALLAHPLVQGLELESLKRLDTQFCVYCGASEVVSGVIEDTGQERVFCAQCENTIL